MSEGRKRWAALCAAALGVWACSTSHFGQDDGRLDPENSTETGNPPVIDIARVALVIKRDEVHVVGEPGAVMPGGILIKVERIATALVETGQVADDGSFDVRVEGGLRERYRLRAVQQEPAAVSDSVLIDRGGAEIAPLSCEQIEQMVGERFAQFPSVIEASCESNEDCAVVSTPAGCPGSACVNVAVGYNDVRQVQHNADIIADWLCAELEDKACSSDAPACPVGGPAACVGGVCRNCAVEDCGGPAACEPCTLPDITWSRTGPDPGAAHVLSQCTRYTVIPATGAQCSNDLPCSLSPGASSRPWTALDVQQAVARSDVELGLRLGTFFGRDVAGGTGTQIRVGERTLIVSDAPCEDAQGCKQPYPDVLALRDLLARIAEQQQEGCP